jgi:pyruvate dehydrogenase E2 component (dihydrolipoamide acetyltransferase)
MAVDITMPQLSDTMSEGTILRWLKKEGDPVKRGEALAEVATDKADLEIEAFHEGTLVKILAETGQSVKVGSVIAKVGEKGETVAATTPIASATTPPMSAAPPTVSSPAATPVGAVPATQYASSESDRVKISPLAKNVAESFGVDYANLSGSGEGGRITKRDVEQVIGRAVAATDVVGQPRQQSAVSVATNTAPASEKVVQFQPQPAAPHSPQYSAQGRSVEPLSKMRQTIASRMVESATTIPHFYATAAVQIDKLAQLRTSLKPLPQYEGLTFNHLIVKAAGLALRAVSRINSAYVDGQLVNPGAVNIGIVTAVPDGLLIPVLKGADTLHLADIVGEARGLVQRARSGRPKADDLSGGTFSISNMGMFGVESFSAIISPGQGAILAVAPIQQEPVIADGQIRVGSVMRLTLSVDHRIIDGVVAGEFLTEIKRLLEDPVLLLA